MENMPWYVLARVCIVFMVLLAGVSWHVSAMDKNEAIKVLTNFRGQASIFSSNFAKAQKAVYALKSTRDLMAPEYEKMLNDWIEFLLKKLKGGTQEVETKNLELEKYKAAYRKASQQIPALSAEVERLKPYEQSYQQLTERNQQLQQAQEAVQRQNQQLQVELERLMARLRHAEHRARRLQKIIDDRVQYENEVAEEIDAIRDEVEV